jgi:hypothetical protein
MSLEAVRQAVDALEWAPLRLSSAPRGRPTSPRLPHALLLHLAHEAREALALAPDRTVSVAGVPLRPNPSHLAALIGTDPPSVMGALDALRQGGLLLAAEDAAAGRANDAVRLAPALLGPAPRCAALDWRALATATAGSPSAWVAAHALAEQLDRYHWTPVARGGLERALGCGVSGVRGALDRLVAAAVVDRREQRGGVSVYRFTEAAWGGAGQASLAPSAAPDRGGAAAAPVAATPLVLAPPPAPPPSITGPPRPATTPAAAVGVRLVVGGVELELPAGLRAQVTIGSDGRPTVTLVGADGAG